jgi:hypothetical protein
MARKRHRPRGQGRKPQWQCSAKGKAAPWWKRPAAWTAGVVSALVIAGAAAIGSGIGQDLLSAVSGDPPTATAGTLSITESGNAYNLLLPVFNPQPGDQQLREATLDVSWDYIPGCLAPAGTRYYAYDVSGALGVEKGSAAGIVSTTSGLTGRNLIQASGTLDEICLFGKLRLSFKPPALILPGKSTTLISVMVPMRMSVTNVNTSAGMPASNFEPRSAAHDDRPPVSLNIPNPILQPGNDTGMEPVVLAKIMLRTDSGTPISACAQLQGAVGGFKTPNFCQSGGLPLSNRASRFLVRTTG